MSIPTDSQYREWFREHPDAVWIAVEKEGFVYTYKEPKVARENDCWVRGDFTIISRKGAPPCPEWRDTLSHRSQFEQP